MKLRYSFLMIMLAMIVSMSSSSCYKILRTRAPQTVKAGEQFEAVVTVVDDGDQYQKEITDWSVAAIRVPEGWDVKCGSSSYRSYSEDWVYYSNGKPASSSYSLVYSESLSAAYNEASPKVGYKWMAFVSSTQITKHMAACWRNGCDSATVTFKVTPDNVPGTYELDYIVGDDEAQRSPKYYTSASEAKKGSRMFHASSLESYSIDETQYNFSNYEVGLSSTVTVTDATDGVKKLTTPQSAESSAMYNLSGQRITPSNKRKNEIVVKKGIKVSNI